MKAREAAVARVEGAPVVAMKVKEAAVVKARKAAVQVKKTFASVKLKRVLNSFANSKMTAVVDQRKVI